MLLIRFLLLCLLSVPALAATPPPSADELDSIFAFRGVIYQQDDGAEDKGGNPTLDEDATIYEGVWLYQQRINDTNAATLKFTGDLVSAASYDDAREKAETISAATGYNPGRFNFELGWKYRSEEQFGLGVHASYGQEYAYRSTGYGLDISQSLNESSTHIALALQVFDDTVRMIRFDGSKEPDEPRKTYSGTLSLNQTLTRHAVLNLSWVHAEQSGMLATSFNSVLAGSERVFETVPDIRVRDTVSVRLKQALDNNSVQFGVSYYEDDWDVRAVVTEVRYFRPFSDGTVWLEPSYRFYHQEGAFFFAPSFEDPGRYRSSDPDLGNFDGHSAGITLSAWRAGWLSQSLSRYDLGLNVYHRTDDLNFYWLTLGWYLTL